ncbi:MAG TPA: hypothetical protein VIS06_21685, partial [Mycobacteriales bacterium]
MTAAGSRDTARTARRFADPDRVTGALAELGLWDTAGKSPADPAAAEVIEHLAHAADPDRAVTGLFRIVTVANNRDTDGDPDPAGLLRRLRDSPMFRSRLVGVLGASAALGDHLAFHPGDWRLLDEEAVLPDHAEVLLTAVGADPADPP